MDADAYARTIAKAQARLIGLQDAALEQSLLAQMPAWIAAGVAPRASEIARALAALPPDEAGLVRKSFIRRWGYAIPCAEAVAALRGLGPMVEVGAGTGYWSALLANAGHDIVATDLTAGIEHPYAFKVGAVAPVAALDACDAVRRHPDRDVLCCWPTQGDGWATKAVAQIRPGRALALIGEARGGVTGDEALFDLLDSRFTPLVEVATPTFPRTNDRLVIYRRA